MFIVDTSAFIAGFDPFSIEEEQYSPQAVREELVSGSMPWTRFNTAVESGRLMTKIPSAHFLDRVRETSKKVGDVRFLSKADMHVLALALEFKDAGYTPIIVTDDYSIQNVADQMGVKFASLTTFGIRFRLHWVLYCPACYRKYPPDYSAKTCEVCGANLKRKPLKKKPLKKGE